MKILNLMKNLQLVYIIIVGIYISYLDLRKGIIPNTVLLITGIPGIILFIIKYVLFNVSYEKNFFLEIGIICVSVILFYAMHIWAAGDTKLIFWILILYPFPIHCGENSTLNIFVKILILSFVIAYIYVVIESIILLCKNKKQSLLDKTTLKITLKRFLISSLYLYLFSHLTVYFMPHNWNAYVNIIIWLETFCVILFLNKNSLKNYWTTVYVGIGMCLVSLIFIPADLSVYVEKYLLLLVFIVIRNFVNQFNYVEIEVSKLCAGMIPSSWAVLDFKKSRVKGLPSNMSEDMGARLSEDEIESIKRWERTKRGKSTIWIVKKIPFAIFVFVAVIISFFFVL